MKRLILLFIIVTSSKLYAQEYIVLYDSSFSFNGFANGSVTAYPNYLSSNSNNEGNLGSGIIYNNLPFKLSLNQNGVNINNNVTRNEINNGISLKGNGARMHSSVLLNLNTYKTDSVILNFTCAQITSVANFANSVRVQYRTDTSSNFQDLIINGNVVQYNAGLNNTNPIQTFSNLLLPQNLWNQKTLQLRWLYFRSAGSANAQINNRDRIRIDDISVSGKPQQLTMRECGFTMNWGRDTLWADTINSKNTIYDFWVWGNGVDFLQTSRRRGYFFLIYAPNINYNTEYNIQIRTNGGEWGPICTFRTPNDIPLTKIKDADCGKTVPLLNSIFGCDWVPFATNYEYSISGINLNTTKLRGSAATSFAFSNFSGFGSNGPQPGRSYNLSVRGIVNNDVGNWGSSCVITFLDSIPLTRIRDTECNITLTTWAKTFRTTTLPYALNYDVQILSMDDTPLGIITTTNGLFTFDQLKSVANPSLGNSTQYKLRVRTRTQELLAEWGSVCTVVTPPTGARYTNSLIEENDIIELKELTRGDESITGVYPNPFNDKLVINLGSIHKDNEFYKISIYNQLGIEVHSILSNMSQFEFENNLPIGIYTLTIQNDILKKSFKIVKQ
jgi:hypothetical protein